MPKPPQAKTVRCAIYTRKSSEEGLDYQQFSSLDAQRQAGESYAASQKHEGWVCLPERYDDGGYTGANTDRPGLTKLLADITAGRVDTVIVYKVDRLSRSLLDFAKLMSLFEQHGVAFVSVTQSFDTRQSMGRLTLNILLSFAQFEREMISERTRDKIAASRRKGLWMGGHPILGFDLDFKNGRLLVNPAEAEQVKAIFAEYLRTCSMLKTLKFIDEKGWRTKRWTTRAGKALGGIVFNKSSLYKMLNNDLYVGKVRHHGDLYQGQHEAILEQVTFDQVQQAMATNGRTGGSVVRNAYGALLKGLIHCGPCGCPLQHTFNARKGGRVYRYYRCCRLGKNSAACTTPPLPAAQIEQLVIDQVRGIGDDPEVRSAVLAAAREAGVGAMRADVDEALTDFAGLWESLTQLERERVVRLVVRRVEYDAKKGTLKVLFRDGASAGVAA